MKLLIPFILGIVIHQCWPSIGASIRHSLVLILLLLFLYFINARWNWQAFYFERLQWGMLFFILLISGHASHQVDRNHLNYLGLVPVEKCFWQARIVQMESNKEGKRYLHAKLVRINGNALPTHNMAVKVWLNDRQNTLEIGDLVMGDSPLHKIENTLLQASFDYADYLASKGIYFQAFNTRLLVLEPSFSLNKLAYQLRKKIEKRYRDLDLKEGNLSLLNAITLGSKTTLDSQLKSDFAEAGAMHILAVSGLHLGIVFLLLEKLLFFLRGHYAWRLLRACLLLLALWGFALITGFSPSVQRAACMFSFIVLGKVLNRESQVVNSICGSALLLLILSPHLLFDLGFQLSYSAVLGIVLIFPKLNQIVSVKNRWLKWVWELSLVSLSAQIASLALSLFYFHQFPNWFLLINLLVIPLAFAVVALCIPVIALGSLATYLKLNVVLDWLLSSMQYAVSFVTYLPYSSSKDIYLMPEEFLLLSLLIFAFVASLYRLNRVMPLVVLCLFIALQVHLLWKDSQAARLNYWAFYQNQKRIYFWRVLKGRAAIWQLSGTKSVFLESQIQSHFRCQGIQWIDQSSSDDKNELFFREGEDRLFQLGEGMLFWSSNKASGLKLLAMQHLNLPLFHLDGKPELQNLKWMGKKTDAPHFISLALSESQILILGQHQ